MILNISDLYPETVFYLKPENAGEARIINNFFGVKSKVSIEFKRRLHEPYPYLVIKKEIS